MADEQTETPPAPMMRTKRRFAHELYPHPEEGEVRPLTVEVPYLYARAVGLQVTDTDWMDWERGDVQRARQSSDRVMLMIDAQGRAFLADALLQGRFGDDAWRWATERNQPDNGGEWVWERAKLYGVEPDQIKPYPCFEEPAHHWHYGDPGARGFRIADWIDGRESDCVECCEPVVAGGS